MIKKITGEMKEEQKRIGVIKNITGEERRDEQRGRSVIRQITRK